MDSTRSASSRHRGRVGGRICWLYLTPKWPHRALAVRHDDGVHDQVSGRGRWAASAFTGGGVDSAIIPNPPGTDASVGCPSPSAAERYLPISSGYRPGPHGEMEYRCDGRSARSLVRRFKSCRRRPQSSVLDDTSSAAGRAAVALIGGARGVRARARGARRGPPPFPALVLAELPPVLAGLLATCGRSGRAGHG